MFATIRAVAKKGGASLRERCLNLADRPLAGRGRRANGAAGE